MSTAAAITSLGTLIAMGPRLRPTVRCVKIECSGCGEQLEEKTAIVNGTFMMCPRCAAIEAGLILSDPEQREEADQHQCECTQCRRSLTAGDGRTYWAICDDCVRLLERNSP